MKLIIGFLLLFSFSANAENLCSKYDGKTDDLKILKSLSKRMDYSFSELCHHDRILDIQKEERTYYYADSKEFELHAVFSLHYSTYSCEHHYNVARGNWSESHSYCYSGW